ncbi:MAG: response regulator [Candidatus Omnitrophica bacterium]|nr:response regulator [Candidatus Omnitrophota bacterium]
MAKKILIVDDNTTLRENLSKLLTEKGYAVKTADCNEAIWNLIKDESFDLMILDIILPDKNTTVILGGLKTHSPQMRIIVYSGYEEYEESPYIRVADAFLCKSKGPEALLSLIEQFFK